LVEVATVIGFKPHLISKFFYILVIRSLDSCENVACECEKVVKSTTTENKSKTMKVTYNSMSPVVTANNK